MKNEPNTHDAPDVFMEFIGAEILFEEKSYQTNLGPGHRLRLNYKPVETDPVVANLRKTADASYPGQRLTFWVPGASSKPISRNPHIKVILKSIKAPAGEQGPQHAQQRVTRKFSISRIKLG